MPNNETNEAKNKPLPMPKTKSATGAPQRPKTKKKLKTFPPAHSLSKAPTKKKND